MLQRNKGTNDLEYIVQYTNKEVKTRQKNVAIARIDDTKAEDMVLIMWIIDC